MSLELIRKGKQQLPPRVVLYGPEKLGKSTFAAGCPDPIFLPTEDGLGQIDCHSFPVATSYQEFLKYLGTVAKGDTGYRTVVIDTATGLQRLIHANVCRRFNVQSLEKADGGYGKGYKHALTEWAEVLNGLDYCRSQGVVVVVLAHSDVRKVQDPEVGGYDRYTLRLHQDAADLLVEWADAVLFGTRKIRVAKEDAGFNRTVGVAKPVGEDGGERVLRCTSGPAAVAGNRYGISGEIPMAWDEFASRIG
jgi:hypothetical protein